SLSSRNPSRHSPSELSLSAPSLPDASGCSLPLPSRGGSVDPLGRSIGSAGIGGSSSHRKSSMSFMSIPGHRPLSALGAGAVARPWTGRVGVRRPVDPLGRARLSAPLEPFPVQVTSPDTTWTAFGLPSPVTVSYPVFAELPLNPLVMSWKLVDKDVWASLYTA